MRTTYFNFGNATDEVNQ